MGAAGWVTRASPPRVCRQAPAARCWGIGAGPPTRHRLLHSRGPARGRFGLASSLPGPLATPQVASGDTSDIGWNFAKFLVNPDGSVAGRWAPTTSPLSLDKKIMEAIGSK